MQRAARLPVGIDDLTRGLAALVEGAVSSGRDGAEAVLARSGGTDFDVSVRAAGYAHHLRRARDPGAPDQAPDCAGHVLCRNGVGAPAWPAWSDAYFRERDVEGALQGGRYRFHYFDECDFWQVYDREARVGVQLMSRPEGYPAWDPGAPLRNFVHWRLLDGGSGLVHAGTLGAGGRGVLLAGAGGSGKSGTVLTGLHHGLHSVGDDYVAVGFEPDCTASRAFRTLKQDPEGLARVGIAPPAGDRVNWQGKHLLRIEDVARVPQPDCLTLCAICLPVVAHAPRTTFTEGAARDAFLALAPSGITQIPSARPEMFAFTARLSRALPVFHVALGTDPREVAEAFAEFLEARGS